MPEPASTSQLGRRDRLALIPARDGGCYVASQLRRLRRRVTC